MSSAPQIPPRPGRSQAESGPVLQHAPVIPPRPQRRNDRSVSPSQMSPSRAEFSRSPLNEPPISMQNGKGYGYGDTLSSSDLPRRPSSAFRPSVVGEEGLEYSSYDDQEASSSSTPKQTRNVAHDLPMHAPTASVPQATAKSRIQTVTRTDSSQAAAAGVGKSSEHEVHPLKARASFSRSNLSVNQSGDDEEHGPPSMGLTVPMLKYAGDAQAPSPAPGTNTQPGTPGGYFKEGAPGRNHHRKRSSRHEFGPPGSYGLHGHGLNSFHGITEPKDQFEKDWYQKHPEEYKKEQGRTYDPGHPKHDWALSSDDLNKLVHQSSNNGLGMGTSPDAVGTPSEQIGYLASEEYASRMSSPRPLSVAGRKRLSSEKQPAISSPLRKASVPDQDTGDIKELDDDQAVSDNEEIIHVDPPAHRHSKIGGGGYDPPKEDFGPEGGNTEEEGGWVIENGYGVPILASDEVAKNKDPSAEYMQPAVSPEQERRGSDYYAGWDSEAPPSYQTGRRSSKDKHGRSSSGEPLSRVRTRDAASGVGTPLEEIEEYEPLFPEEDEKEPPKPKAVNRLSRPDLARHHFPSQDVWEDVPESLQYQTTVDTPQEPEDLSASTTFEHPAKEAARKDGPIATDRADFLSDEAKRMAKPHFKPGVMDEVRPNMRHRFPSQDIWEDSPDSLHYETTVDSPQVPEDLESSTGTLPPAEDESKPHPKFNNDVEELRQRPDLSHRFPSHDIWEDSPESFHLQTTVSGPQSPEVEDVLSPDGSKSSQSAFNFGKPQLPSRPARPSKLSEEIKPVPSIPARPPQRLRQVPPADAEVPQIPARPGAGSVTKAPVLPDRPKPQIPARPVRAPRADSQEHVPLAKTTSNVSAGSAESGVKSPPEVKAKPAIPARPVNANFANLRAGFMNDLNSRLKIGPSAPKKEEENVEEIKPEEKTPLADARKGRTRGPARRKPAAAAAGTATTDAQVSEQQEASSKSLSLAISSTTTIWTIGEEGTVHVPEHGAAESVPTPTILSPQEQIEQIADANTDSAGPVPSSQQANDEDETVAANTLSDPVGAAGDAADPSKLSSATEARGDAIESGLEAALADSRNSGHGPAQGSTDVAAHVSEFSSEVPTEVSREGKDIATEQQKTESLRVAAPTAELPGRFVDSDDEGEKEVKHDVTNQESQAAEEVEPKAGAEVEEGSKAQMVDTSAQTGEKDVTVRSPTGEEEKMTITLGGMPQTDGHVVKKGDEEIVGGSVDI